VDIEEFEDLLELRDRRGVAGSGSLRTAVRTSERDGFGRPGSCWRSFAPRRKRKTKRVIYLPSRCPRRVDRSVRPLAQEPSKRHREFIQIFADALAILEQDPLKRRATGNTGSGLADGDSATTSRVLTSHFDTADGTERTRIADDARV
jgi:hypothetical protein